MSDAPTTQRRRAWYREPLLHFLLIGAAIFAVSRFTHEDTPHSQRAEPTSTQPDPEAARSITLTAERVSAMRDEHQRRTGSPPDDDQMAALIETAVRGELLYHEALRLGLDRDDPIVRRRLVQKMTFLIEDLSTPPTLDDATLEAYYREHAEDYRRSPTTSLTHVFISTSDTTSDPSALLNALLNGTDPETLGAPFLHGRDFTSRSDAQLDATFGAGFARALTDLPEGRWSGPIPSPYGAHLVRIEARTPSTLPPLDSVRAQVQRAALERARAEAIEAELDALRERYTVTVEEPTP